MKKDGILLIDKSKGYSSFDIARQARCLLGVKKVGHVGTLDPLATGLLVLVIGNYTKLAEYFSKRKKTYLAKIKFGKSTLTDDSEGEIVDCGDFEKLDFDQIKEALGCLSGYLLQNPPNYSALLVNGKRAYREARQGNALKLRPRRVKVTNGRLLNFVDGVACVRVTCSSGTYVRSIARDMGLKLKVPAYLLDLRRINIGDLSLKDAIPCSSLSDFDFVTKALKKDIGNFNLINVLSVSKDTVSNFKRGKKVFFPGDDRVALVFWKNETVVTMNFVKNFINPSGYFL